MYDKQIEDLIKIALQDGVLNEKERKVLIKKAESLGIDVDEFEMVLDARLQSAQLNAMQEIEEAASNPQAQVPLHELALICKGCGNARLESDKICPKCGYRHASIVEDFQRNLEIARQRAREDAEKKYNKAMKKYEKSVKQRTTSSESSEGFWGMVSRAANTIQNVVTKPSFNNFYRKLHDEYRSIVLNSLPIPSTESELMELLDYLHSQDDRFGDEEWHTKKLAILAILERRAGFLQKLQLRKYRSHCKDI